jgi:hypothetical protein
MLNRRNLAWKLCWYRQSELEGALLLGKLVSRVRQPYLLRQLVRHCADEARHAWLWEQTIATLGLPTLYIQRSYQSFYLDEISRPRSAVEVLALTHVFELRVHRQFTEDLNEPGLPDEARRTFEAMLRDEQGHLEWIARWLKSAGDAESLLTRYREADERVYQRLAVFRDHVWDIPNLGDNCSWEDTHDRASEEHHPAQPQHSVEARS